MDDSYCSNWPKWLRYLLAIPGGIIAWILSGAVLPFLFTIYLERNSWGYEITHTLVAGIGATYCALYIFYTLPPKHKLVFLVIPSIAYILLILWDFVYYYYLGATWDTWLMLIAGLLTCIGVNACRITESISEKTIIEMKKSTEFKTETDKEILSYIDEKSSEMNITPEEYIKKVKAYEEYQKNNKED